MRKQFCQLYSRKVEMNYNKDITFLLFFKYFKAIVDGMEAAYIKDALRVISACAVIKKALVTMKTTVRKMHGRQKGRNPKLENLFLKSDTTTKPNI